MCGYIDTLLRCLLRGDSKERDQVYRSYLQEQRHLQNASKVDTADALTVHAIEFA
jgi:hypothetical protein